MNRRALKLIFAVVIVTAVLLGLPTGATLVQTAWTGGEGETGSSEGDGGHEHEH